MALSSGDGTGNVSLSIPAAFTVTYDKAAKTSCIGQTVDESTCRVFYSLTGICVTLNPGGTGSSGPTLGAGPSSTGPGCAPLPRLPEGMIVIPPRADSCGAPGLTTGLGIGQYTASSTQPAFISLANVPVTVRAAGDPYLAALAATEATGDYGASPASQRSIAIAMWAVVGAVVVLLLLLGCCPPTIWGRNCYRDRSDAPVLLQPDCCCCGGEGRFESFRTEGVLACGLCALLLLAVILWFVIGSIAASSAVPQVCVEGLLCAGAIGGGGNTKISYGCPKVGQLLSLGGTTKTALALQIGGLGVTGAGILGSALVAAVAKGGMSGIDGEGAIAVCVAFLIAPGIVVGPVLYFAAAIYARMRLDAVTGDVCTWLTTRGYAAGLCSAGEGFTTYLPAAAGLLAFIIAGLLCGYPCIAACAKAIDNRNGDPWADAPRPATAAARAGDRGALRDRQGDRGRPAALRTLRDSFRGASPAGPRDRPPGGGGATASQALRAASTRNLPRGAAAIGMTAPAAAAFDIGIHADNNIIRPQPYSQPQPIAGSFFRAPPPEPQAIAGSFFRAPPPLPPPPPGVRSSPNAVSAGQQRRGTHQPPVGAPPANRYHLPLPPPPPLPDHLAVPVGHRAGHNDDDDDDDGELHASNVPAYSLEDNRIVPAGAAPIGGSAAAAAGRSPSGHTRSASSSHLRTISVGALRTISRSGVGAGAGSSRMLRAPSSRSPSRTATLRADRPSAMGGAASGAVAGGVGSAAMLNPGLAFYASSTPRASLGRGRRATGQTGSASASRMASANDALRSASARGRGAAAAAAAGAAAAAAGVEYDVATDGVAAAGDRGSGGGGGGGSDGYYEASADAVPVPAGAAGEPPAAAASYGAAGYEEDEYGPSGGDHHCDDDAAATQNPMGLR